MPSRDLSRRARSDFKQKLEQSGVLLELLESMSEGVYITDPQKEDNPGIYANPAFIELTGYEPEEFLGENCRFLQKGDRDQEGLGKIQEAIKNEEHIRVRLRNYKKSGEMFWNELSIAPVHDNNGELIYFIGIQHDVTSEEKMQRAREDFVSLVTHQLRTPITTLRLSSEMLKEEMVDLDNDEAKTYLSYIENSSERMATIVRDILNITRIESGDKIELEKEPADVHEVISMVIRDIIPLTKQKHIDVRVNDQRDNTDPVRMEKDLVYQAIYNLIVNAVQYSHENATVTINIKTTDDAVMVAVKDTGIGIPEDAQDRIFERQFRAENAKEYKKEGTGLGLYLTKKIAELHEGSVSFESQKGKGSTFQFSLPKQ